MVFILLDCPKCGTMEAWQIYLQGAFSGNMHLYLKAQTPIEAKDVGTKTHPFIVFLFQPFLVCFLS